MTDSPFAPLDSTSKKPARKAEDDDEWELIAPIPANAPPRPDRLGDLGEPSFTWAYHDRDGNLWGYVYRFDKNGEKTIRPLHLFRNRRTGKMQWKFKAAPAPRILYALDEIASRPNDPILVVEGEKSAEAGAVLLPGFVVTTTIGGSKSADHADFSPVAGRSCIIWRDADEAGANYQADLIRLLTEAGAASIATVEPPSDKPQGWDVADARQEGWTPEQAFGFVQTAKLVTTRAKPVAAASEAFITPAMEASNVVNAADRFKKRKTQSKAKNDDGAQGEDDGGRRARQREQLLDAVKDIELFHDKSGDGFAIFPRRGHSETEKIQSTRFKKWLGKHCLEVMNMFPGKNATEDLANMLDAMAMDAPEREPTRRVGKAGDKIYLDLCNDEWKAIEIDSEGWRVVDRSAAAMVRTSQMHSLPTPEAGYEINELRRFLNTDSEDDFILLVCWIIAAVQPIGPYPILVFTGEQGTGKSTISRLVRSLIDPNKAPVRTFPKDERDLMVSASNAHAMVFDNVSSISNSMADSLCRLATGSGFATKANYTDSEEHVMVGARPIILNGIPSLVERADLADRAITVRLRPFGKSERSLEKTFWRDWEAVAPRVMGAILDAITAGLGRLAADEIVLADPPRMADFATLATACERGLGFKDGSFMRAYSSNHEDVAEASFEANPIAMAIRALIATDFQMGWDGTPTELLAALNIRAEESTKRLKLWPVTAQAMGTAFDRVAPLLRAKGYAIDRSHRGVRRITIVPKSAPV